MQVSIEVGVACGTTKFSSARHTLFLLIAKHKFDINGLLNNSSLQQRKLESESYRAESNWILSTPPTNFLIILGTLKRLPQYKLVVGGATLNAWRLAVSGTYARCKSCAV